MDYMKQERERGITITSAAITFGWENHRINLIDTPGHVDFTIEVERSIRVLDGAVTILDAVSGVEAQTQTVWSQADRYDIPRIAYVNKMDRLGARFGRTVYEMYSKLQTRPLVCQLPVLRKDDYGNIVFSGVVDLLELEVIDWDKNPNGTTITRTPLTESYPQIPNLYSEAIKARSILVETLSESDDYLLEKFLETENSLQVSAKDIREAIRKATITCKVVPVFCGASFRNIGLKDVPTKSKHAYNSSKRDSFEVKSNKKLQISSKITILYGSSRSDSSMISFAKIHVMMLGNIHRYKPLDSITFNILKIKRKTNGNIPTSLNQMLENMLKKNPNHILWTFAIFSELHSQHPYDVHRVRNLFDKALECPKTKNSISLWALYINYEIKHEQYSKAKILYYNAIRECPWSKDLYMIAFRKLRSQFSTEELDEVMNVMLEKEIRLRVSMEKFTEEKEQEETMTNIVQ
ncbi:933_t:CDS:2 [Entrophospora sp. SA101]|nr:933_t:CDS:2 [Entrophospora sp. SA101]